MATIAVEISGIKGGFARTGYEDQVEAVGIREAIEAGIGTSTRTGRGRHSDIELIRYRDWASPKLAQACSAATNLGQVKIRVFQSSQGRLFMQYTLEQVFVARMEHETLDEGYSALQQGLRGVSRGLPNPGSIGLASVLAPVISSAAATSRVVPTGVTPIAAGYGNREIERVFLNVKKVTWTYIDSANATVEKSFDLITGDAA